ncbi:MAG: alternative ribosome rescue aminoacyl-tRNA hydrolase ArfB [Pirellulales bacterium]
MKRSNSPLVITSQVSLSADELKFTFVRSTGPGGQNVNKVNSKAVLHWNIRQSTSLPEDVKQRFLSRYVRRISHEGQLILSSDRHREQARNVTDCGRKLRELVLSVLTPPKPRKQTKPSRGAVLRRLQQKRNRALRKQTRRFRPDDE